MEYRITLLETHRRIYTVDEETMAVLMGWSKNEVVMPKAESDVRVKTEVGKVEVLEEDDDRD